jgi:RNA polymerase sigma-70 factor, ECF subfamily
MSAGRSAHNAAIAAFASVRRDPRSLTDLVDLERAIARLPQRQRRVPLLIGLEEMTYAQAAAVLGLPEDTARASDERGCRCAGWSAATPRSPARSRAG